MMVYDFYSTSCLIFILEPWRGDRKQNKLDDNHIASKTVRDFFISHILSFCVLKIPF